MSQLRITGAWAAALAALLVATSAQADTHTHARAQQPANASGHRGSAPAPAAAPSGGYSHQASGAPYRGGYAGGYAYGPRYYSSGYYYTGWGIHPWGYWGVGYYPYYGGPVIAEQVPLYTPVITSSVMLGGMISGNGPGVDLRLATDGSNWGANFTFLTLPTLNPGDSSDVQIAPYMNAHVTYSIISNLHARVRVEAGGSLVTAPAYTYLGPDIGASALLELVGPLGVDGSFHWTPLPADIIDADAGIALHFGALAIRGGWRVIRLDDSRVDTNGGSTVFSGPTASVGLVF